MAVSAVLAAYMGGLALGAGLIEKHIQRITRPVLWYATLELGIGVSALLLVPAGLWLTEHLLTLMFGGQSAPPSTSLGGTTLFYLLASGVILLIPTTLMGATLPLLARYSVREEEQIGQRIGLLYACNTAGAVGGALLAALVLLPGVGLHKTVWVAALLNVLVGVLAALLARMSITRNAPVAEAALLLPAEKIGFGASAAWVLPLMLLSGAVSFLHEVLWTRMLGHITGSSIYAFGIMVASFLSGIAVGGGLGAKLAEDRETAAHRLALSEMLAALAAVGAWLALKNIDAQIDSLAQRLGFGFALLFPLACAIGLTYPLAVRVLARDVNDAAVASARVYAWNTIGAILGSLIGGFAILPLHRYEGAVQLAVFASCVLALLAMFILFRPNESAEKRFAVGLTIAALAIAVLFKPQPPEALLRYSPLRVNGQGDLLFYGVGRSATVVALRQGDQMALRTNGLPEASIDGVGTIPQMYVEAWMAPLAVLARPQTINMLIVGFGGGRVVEAVPQSVKDIDVIELEDQVIQANRKIAPHRLRDPLDDRRVHLISNDARGALQLTDKHYDVVVSQPSHPWTAGASHLYTREFMQQAREHLNPGGLFVQWMNVDFLDEALLRSLVATIHDVYPYVRVYRPAPPTLLFFASDKPIEPERDLAATRAALAEAPADYARMGINAAEDLVACWVLDDDSSRAFAGNAAIISDDRNRFATDNVYDRGRNITPDTAGRLLLPDDPLLQAQGFLYRDNTQLDWGYILRRIGTYVQWDSSARERLVQLSKQFQQTELQPYIAALNLQNSMQLEQAQQERISGLANFPHSDLLRDAILENSISELASGHAPDNIATLALQSSATTQLLIKASHYAFMEDWDNVSRLDDTLAQVPWTSIWFAQATQLRVEWRAHSRDAAMLGHYAAENLAMIERLSLSQAVPQMMLIRAISGSTLHQPAIIMESINRYATSGQQTASTMDSDSRRRFIDGLRTLQPLLTALKSEPMLDKARLTEVQKEFAQASRLQ